MLRRRIHIILIFCLAVLACEKEYSWDFKTEDLDRVVVDGIITNELRSQEIKLTRTNDELNQVPEPLSGADIWVVADTNRFEFTEVSGIPGIYLSEPFQAVINQTYHLRVVVESDTFTASAGLEPVTPLSDLVTVLDSSRNQYRYIFNEGGRPSMTKVFYDWSEDSAYCQEYGSCMAQEAYYRLDNTDINEIFGPDTKVLWFPPGTIVVREKYSLTESHQEFIRTLLMETDWSGGYFDVQHGNVRTNLSNGALGYFAACMVVRDTSLVGINK